jgi:transcriptional regulator with XRE-family HTH domain
VIDKQLFGQWLRELRQQRKITQSELARLLGIGRSTLSEVESGKHFPPVEVVVWFLKEVNASPQEWGNYGIAVEGRQENLSGERAGAGMTAEAPLGKAENEAVQRLLRLLHTGNKRIRRHLLHQLRLLEDAASALERTTEEE